LAASMGYSHDTLMWTGWKKRGNLQDAARTARRSLMADWASKHGIATIALGHTADDQAETFLMRLARGSGVDGLASMDPLMVENDVQWARPLLGVRREALRTYLFEIGAKYVDDPSNEDDNFDRIKVRQALGTLGALGIDVPKISKTTERLRSAKQVVYTATRDLSLAASEVTDAGEMKLDWARLSSGQQAIRHRIMSKMEARSLFGENPARRKSPFHLVWSGTGVGWFLETAPVKLAPWVKMGFYNAPIGGKPAGQGRLF